MPPKGSPARASSGAPPACRARYCGGRGGRAGARGGRRAASPHADDSGASGAARAGGGPAHALGLLEAPGARRSGNRRRGSQGPAPARRRRHPAPVGTSPHAPQMPPPGAPHDGRGEVGVLEDSVGVGQPLGARGRARLVDPWGRRRAGGGGEGSAVRGARFAARGGGAAGPGGGPGAPWRRGCAGGALNPPASHWVIVLFSTPAAAGAGAHTSARSRTSAAAAGAARAMAAAEAVRGVPIVIGI
jgi:hypothetical protein